MKRHGSMNRAYRLIWSRVINAWVVASEIARGRGKSSGSKLAPSFFRFFRLLAMPPR